MWTCRLADSRLLPACPARESHHSFTKFSTKICARVLIAAIVRTRCSTARRLRAQNTSLARFSLTNHRSGARRGLTPPHTPAHSRLFAIYLHPRKRRAYADGKRIAFRSTLPAGGVKHAKETAKSRLRCTFCRRCMLSVMSAAASGLKKETLEVTYKKKNIYQALRMTVEEALSFFEDIPQIYDRLKP